MNCPKGKQTNKQKKKTIEQCNYYTLNYQLIKLNENTERFGIPEEGNYYHPAVKISDSH